MKIYGLSRCFRTCRVDQRLERRIQDQQLAYIHPGREEAERTYFPCLGLLLEGKEELAVNAKATVTICKPSGRVSARLSLQDLRRNEAEVTM